MATVNITAGDRYYTVEVQDYTAPERATAWDPGDGGEISLGGPVEVEYESGFQDVVTYQTFLYEVALVRGTTLTKAEVWVQDQAFEQHSVRMAEQDYDDRDDGGDW